MNKSEAFDVAMLAGLVSSNLSHVDKNMVNSSRPVNQINMSSFVSPLVNGGNAPQPRNTFEPTNTLMQKAVEDSLKQAMAAIPDPVSPNIPASSMPDLIPLPSGTPVVVSQTVQQQPRNASQETSVGISSEDIKIIKSQLEKINTNLTKMTGMFGKVFATITTQNISGKHAK